MSGEWMVVTGANAGIGKEIARALAQKGHPVILACRNVEKAAQACREIAQSTGNPHIEALPLDLASFGSIYRFAEQVKEGGFRLKALINNAGVMCKEYQTTHEGFEMTVGVNYLATCLLTQLLIPLLQETPDARIVNTTSITYKMGQIDADFLTANPKSFRRISTYPASKLAVLLYTLELSERLAGSGVSAYAVDPGIVNTGMISMHSWYDPLTDLFFRPFIKSARKGAETAVFLATAEKSTLAPKNCHSEQNSNEAEASSDFSTQRSEAHPECNKNDASSVISTPSALLGAGSAKQSGEIYGNRPLLFANCRPQKVPQWVVNHPYRRPLWDDTHRLLANRSKDF